MTYYILLPNDKEVTDANVLGEDNGFGRFDYGLGMDALTKIINKYPEYVEHIKIIDDNKKEYSVEDFLDIIAKFKERR